MRNDRYNTLSKGQKFGCAAAMVSMGLLSIFLAMLDALGDCAPSKPCSKGIFTNVILPSVVVSLIVYLVVKTLIDKIADDKN
jgi:hypothetical protein